MLWGQCGCRLGEAWRLDCARGRAGMRGGGIAVLSSDEGGRGGRVLRSCGEAFWGWCCGLCSPGGRFID